MPYHELWTVLWNWKKEFTVREFSSTFASPDPNKDLHDMAQKGFLERVGWGKYKVNSPEEVLTKRTNIAKSYDLLNEVSMHYALTGPDAVFFWTKGGYQIDRFFGFYPIHLKVEEKDLTKWEGFFNSRKQRFYVKGQPIRQTFFGLFYVAYPEVDFRAEKVSGFCVIPLKETVEFCQRNIYSYEPALEMLDEMYDLGLKVRYMETKTNF
ncbi:hypothetical protein MUP77_22345 [Candidatus Bathyarchaeota archaeon]|nr:hypothetical protein [Candidatus Bathyarchaeota archaeon]